MPIPNGSGTSINKRYIKRKLEKITDEKGNYNREDLMAYVATNPNSEITPGMNKKEKKENLFNNLVYHLVKNDDGNQTISERLNTLVLSDGNSRNFSEVDLNKANYFSR